MKQPSTRSARTTPAAAAAAALLAIAASSAGCVSYPNDRFPAYTYDQLRAPQGRIAVDYEARFVAFGTDSPGAQAAFAAQVQDVLTRSGLFRRVEPGRGYGRKYHFVISMRNDGNLLVATTTKILSALTLFLLPGYSRDEYTLTVVVEGSGSPGGRYEFTRSVTTWTQLFTVFWMPSDGPGTVIPEVFESMLLAFLHDAQQEGLF